MTDQRQFLLAFGIAASLLSVARADDLPKTVEWTEVAPAIYRTTSSPFGHAIVDGDRCLLVGAPYRVGPTTLPGRAKQCDLVILTHHHRDTSATATAFAAANIPVRAPKLSEAYLSSTAVSAYWDKSIPVATPGRFPPLMERFWNDWTYLVHAVGIDAIQCDLKDRDQIAWQGWQITALATAGHSRDHMSFLAIRPSRNADRICFCGDAIAASGKIWSPYTLEWHHQKDEGAVAASTSLRSIAAEKPTLLLPEHGEPIRDDNVQSALLETAELLGQLGAAKNYDAFTRSLGSVPGYRFLAPEQVGTANPQGNPVPWTKLSPHLYLTGNTHAICSKDGPVLLMDPYSRNIVERVAELKRDHGFGPVEVAMISHAHNDHYTGIFALPDRKSFQVWTLNLVAETVDHPHRYLAPYVDARVPHVDRSLKEGEVIRWHEYELKIHHLPGQTVFAMGVEAQIDGKKCLFTGDNFYHHDQYTGSGGWSGRNRGLPAGYAASTDLILKMRPDWILAEHGGAFEFHPEDFRRRREFALRAAELADRLSPRGDHRVDWDPQRIRIEPLITPATAGATIRCQLKIDNPLKRSVRHSIRTGRPELPARQWEVTTDAESTSTLDIPLQLPAALPAGRLIVPMVVEEDNNIDSSDTFVVLDIQSPASQ